MHPFLFWMGYRRLYFPRESAAQILTLCSEEGWVYRSPEFREEWFTLLCSLRVAKAMEGRLPVLHREEFGLPFLLGRYRDRWGIWIGLCLSALLIWGSGQVVWQIRVDGNDQTKDEQIVALLRTCGLEVGDRISQINVAALENRMLIESPTLSWISVNLRGTVAEVEVREILPPPEEERYGAANLVASRDGVIQWLEDVRGNVAVSVGDVVSEGELLVGGLYSPEGGGLRYTVAKGRVMAQTSREFQIEIPFSYEKKVYTGEEKVEKYLIFFKKEIKIFGNANNLWERCDTIDMVEYFEPLDGAVLPIGIRTVRYLEYRQEERRRDEQETVRLAYECLSRQMEEQVPEGMLLRKRLTEEWTEEGFRLLCRGEYLENIAKTKEIEIDEAKNRKN